ncbi:LysE family translocator [Oryzifoliimicrobium ureilyticus]|uniref:LysE family translocator n=1 Tax=Oryzifoliimicrobium ureilyticus TaxID=3113724 RepID=UPI00307616BC
MLSVMIANALLALSIAVPFGPISLMCVQRALIFDPWRALACGAGASTAHAVFAAFAFLGAHYAIGHAVGLKPLLQSISGLLLFILGIRILFLARRGDVSAPVTVSVSGDFAAGLTMALCNPTTILRYIALSGSDISQVRGIVAGLTATISGVVLGTVVWYAVLACSASAVQSKVSRAFLARLNFLSGATLAVMGLSMVALSRSGG